MAIRETLKQGGYTHFHTLSKGEHILFNVEQAKYELWFCNKNHASYGLIYGNTHLEFARTINENDATIWGEVKKS